MSRFSNILRKVLMGGICLLGFLSVCYVVFTVWREPTAQAGAEWREIEREKADRIAGAIWYIYEERAGLCYSYYASGPVIDCVPCEEVKDYLKNPPKDTLWRESRPQETQPARQ